MTARYAFWFCVNGACIGSHELYRVPTYSQVRLCPRLVVVTLPRVLAGMDWGGRLVLIPDGG